MVTTLTIPNVVARLVILAIGMVIAYWVAWHNTSDLASVHYRHFYRFCFFMSLVRGWMFLWFKTLNLFPIVE